ncbi:MAG: undecaprenyl-phosphate glucose phosphotransferase [Lentisphaerae bacterium]|nr:undecaprenyl-phosphate glucose phosphotransferase [Lentisphaerota bacterium]
MRKKDTLDVLSSVAAVAADAFAVFSGFMLATWLRFDSKWIPLKYGYPPQLYLLYAKAAIVGTVIFLFVFRYLQLYVRPQLGRFESKIPRIVRAVGLSLVICVVLAFAAKNTITTISSGVLLISFITVSFCAVLERYILFRIELHYARHSPTVNYVLILGTDEVALRLTRSLAKEPKLRSAVVGFLRTNESDPHPEIPADLIKGTIADFDRFIHDKDKRIDQIILTNSSLDHKQIVDLIVKCEKNMIRFNMVPDVFRILTGTMDVQSIDDIPLLGIRRRPLDFFWNRVLKRTEDILGSIIGLSISAPVIAIAAVLIKRSSPGPVFYCQSRCGEEGTVFTLYKLRTMPVDAENATGPVFTSENDSRRTKIGAFLRSHNLDELPQFWNVLKGDMSLVGPRPERPHFVEQFKENFGSYMSRHVSKPGLTGWAQINGLRGNTSIEERIKYDLYYLENWSLAFDFKIIARTMLAKENAY